MEAFVVSRTALIFAGQYGIGTTRWDTWDGWDAKKRNVWISHSWA
jgi:hypothetical protein